MSEADIFGMAVRAQWVIDHPVFAQRLTFKNGKAFEYPARALEWPLQPVTLTDWRDVLYEGLSFTPTASGLFRPL